MPNYYDILGLPNSATILEVKAAFRRLAKLYHPDRNPNGKEHFEHLLKSYETLSDPHLKAAYDQRLLNSQTREPAPDKKAGTKNWSFSEKELKRRQYYNEHIRRYAKATATYNAEVESRKSYNEFKYILYAVPLAVALFLLVMRFATPESRLTPGASFPAPTDSAVSISPPRQGDSPYRDYFGDGTYDERSSRVLAVRNHTGYDIVLCVFHDSAFVRGFFMESGFAAEMRQLPEGEFHVRYTSGKKFDYLQRPDGAAAPGAFTQELKYYEGNVPNFAGKEIELTLLPGANAGFVEVGADRFFRKSSL